MTAFTTFDGDIIGMQAAELNGVCLDITLNLDTGESIASLKNCPVELVESLPDINEVNLHTPLFNLADGLLYVAYENSGIPWGKRKRDWVSAKFSKY